MPGLFPLQPGLASGAVPVALHVTFHVVPVSPFIASTGLPAVLVRRAIVLIGRALRHVGPGAIGLAPVGILDRRIDLLGDGMPRQATCDRPGGAADHSSNRT